MTGRTTILILILTLSLFALLLIGCSMSEQKEDASSLSIPAKELLLGINVFPAGWTFNPCEENCERIEGAAHAERS